MIYKYTKCESVIAKIMADLDMSENNIRITDMKEWIFEAMEKIGAPMQYILKESGVDFPILDLHEYQVPLPDDLVHLTAVAYSTSKEGRYVVARTNDAQFKYETSKHRPFRHNPIQPMSYKLPTSQSQFYGVNLNKYQDKYDNDDVTYFLKPGWIVLNKKDGFVKISYKAIPTDEKGYPLIPDLASYQEAIYWYVTMKLTFPKWLNGNFETKRGASGAQNAYAYTQSQWNFYRNQAYAEAMMPTEGDMISIKNEWNKLIPEWDSDKTFFSGEGKEQLNYTDYYYGH